MKQFLTMLLLSAVVLSGCKRGEEDPGLTLKSRDSRIEGVWKLASYSTVSTTVITNTAPQGGISNLTTTVTTTFSGSSASSVTSFNNNGDVTTSTSSWTYVLEMELTKAGLFKFAETYSDESAVEKTEGEGTWMWSNTGKNKTGIITSAFTDSYLGIDDGQYTIKKLSSKELVLTFNYSTKFNKSPVGTTEEDIENFSVEGEMIFEIVE